MSKKLPKNQQEVDQLQYIFNNEDITKIKRAVVSSFNNGFAEYTYNDLLSELYSIDPWLLAWKNDGRTKLTTYAYIAYVNHLVKLRNRAYNRFNTSDNIDNAIELEDSVLDELYVDSYVNDNFDELSKKAIADGNRNALIALLDIKHKKQ